jgi:hypothetical protein
MFTESDILCMNILTAENVTVLLQVSRLPRLPFVAVGAPVACWEKQLAGYSRYQSFNRGDSNLSSRTDERWVRPRTCGRGLLSDTRYDRSVSTWATKNKCLALNHLNTKYQPTDRNFLLNAVVSFPWNWRQDTSRSHFRIFPVLTFHDTKQNVSMHFQFQHSSSYSFNLFHFIWFKWMQKL